MATSVREYLKAVEAERTRDPERQDMMLKTRL
jgi:hypothetical protein